MLPALADNDGYPFGSTSPAADRPERLHAPSPGEPIETLRTTTQSEPTDGGVDPDPNGPVVSFSESVHSVLHCSTNIRRP